MKSYPMMLQIENKQVAMIGGGSIAVRKVKRLLQSRAQVTVIAPDIDPELYRLYKANEIRWKKKMFEPIDLVGAFLIFAATNSRDVNEAVEYAAGPDQLVNVIDNKHGGNFH
ncbi:MAG TPA: siroheme synthase, partial [Candidatus Avamphibacillus intestinigallinarum]|nr:siroheme synthase [Candidatus Avamphibacillus intestinigallinarum]